MDDVHEHVHAFVGGVVPVLVEPQVGVSEDTGAGSRPVVAVGVSGPSWRESGVWGWVSGPGTGRKEVGGTVGEWYTPGIMGPSIWSV